MAKAQCTFVSSWSDGLEIKSKAMVCLDTGEVTDIEVSDTLPDDDATLSEEYIEIANSTFTVVDVNEEDTYFVINLEVLKQVTANLGVEKICFIVPRTSDEEVTFAVVDAKVESNLYEEEAFLNALDATLTEWFQTEEGQIAWNDSSEDFNVGDLIAYQGNDDLIELLRQNGIYRLSIEIYQQDRITNWTFDRVLGAGE